MLWYKSWLETRSRFLIGLVLLMVMAAGTVLDYRWIQQLRPLAESMPTSGEIGRLIRESVDLSSTFNGHVWTQWFRQNLSQTGTLFAVLLGSGGLVSQASGGAALFTLSLPVSRTRILATRAATGLGESFALALVPSLVIPLLAPGVGQSYSVVATIVHAICLFVAGSVFFSLALLLSTMFADVWRPLLATCAVAVLISGCEALLGDKFSYGPFRLMSGEQYFRGGGVSWAGLVAAATVSAALLYGATVSLARRDF